MDARATTLHDTIEGMTSSDYKERFTAEYQQIRLRMSGLASMLVRWDNGQLDFTPTCPREVLQQQLAAMALYSSLLEKRAKIEGIELAEVSTL